MAPAALKPDTRKQIQRFLNANLIFQKDRFALGLSARRWLEELSNVGDRRRCVTRRQNSLSFK
jgi:hypothetical protein